jgi:NAD(P)-dependent dehydrogenase (short-subunit alcohol dehydrogenase family)
MATYLITGASRGIGLELTKQLLELPASQIDKIFAVTRSNSSSGLQELIGKNPNRLVNIIASVDDTNSVQNAAREVKTKLGSKGLDVLVNNAGMLFSTPGGMRNVPPEQLAQLFDVNVIGIQRVTSAFLPLLEIGKEKKVINLYVARWVICCDLHTDLILGIVPQR